MEQKEQTERIRHFETLLDQADQANGILARALEAFEKAANGQSTKIIIPSEIQGLAGLASALTEISKEDGKPSQPAE